MTWLRAAVLSAWAIAAVSGCGSDPNDIDLVIRFENDELKRASNIVHVRLIEGGCGGTDSVYDADVAVSGTSMPTQPDTLPKGTYGFSVEARDIGCNILATTCIDVSLPIDGERVEITLREGSGSGGGCAGLEECLAGRCIAMRIDAGPDAQVMCEGEGTPCEDGAGRCYNNLCCFGCFDGMECAGGRQSSACGIGGEMCAACDPGDVCTGGTCEATSTAGQFYLSSASSSLRSADGRLYTVGIDSDAQKPQPTPRDMTNDLTFSQYLGPERFVDVAGTQYTGAGITDEGHLFTWGSNLSGSLGRGLGVTVVEAAPDRVTMIGDETYTDVTAGDRHFCAIRSDDSLWCWGSNEFGQLGIDMDLGSANTPRQVMPGATWTRLAPGVHNHTCAIQSDQTLWCWGDNAASQLARPNTTAFSRQPVQIAGQWTAAATGVFHSCGIKTDGTLSCWGAVFDMMDNAGQLGTGDRNGVAEPVQVGTRSDWRAIAAGESHSCGLLSVSGSVNALCWGLGIWGQLGRGSMDDSLTPAAVMGAGGWESIATGWRHSCGMRMGTGYCWGENVMGKLGDASTMFRIMPVEVILNPP